MDQPIYHTHDGINSPRIPGGNLLGFPIFRLAAIPPTHKADEGTQIYVILTGAPDTYYLYSMLDRTWRGVQLPL